MRRSHAVALFVLLGILVGCSSGSGVGSSKTLASLSAEEYGSVCKFFNDKSQALVGQTCAKTQQKVIHVMRLDCDAATPFKDTPCTATVSDVEACASKTDACAALPRGVRPAECVKIAQCVGGGS